MRRIGQYEVTAESGSGSRGPVCQARDTVTGLEVALKIFRTAPGAEPEARQRWIREAKACTGLQHPNIVPVLDVGEADGALYVAMEWLHGVDLDRFIREARILPLAEKLEIMAQVCDGLEHAHRHGVLHRDVKPSNLFLCHGRPLRILDFGLARLPSARRALAAAIPGTPNYFAPELILRQPCDSRADVFSAAVVFLEFLVSAHPFQHAFIPRRIVESLPDSPRIRNPQVPMEVERLLMRGIEKDPERRIPTANELGSELREIARYIKTGQGGGGPSPSLVGAAQPRKTYTREPVVAAAAAMNQATAGDPADRRVSDVILLMGEFDGALARWELECASGLIERMRAAEALDGRFGLVISDCEQRLEEISAAPRPVSPPRPAPPAAAASQIRVAEPVRMRPLPAEPPPAEPVASSTPLAAAPPAGPAMAGAAVDKPEANASPPDAAPAAPAQAAQAPPPASGPAPASPKPSYLWILAAAGAGFAVVLVVFAAFRMVLGPADGYPERPHVATAVVTSESTDLREREEGTSRRIATARRGDAIHILSLPRGHGQEWIAAQIVGPETSAPGFVRAVDVSQWSGERPETVLTLLTTYAPGDRSQPEALEAHAGRLRALLANHPQFPEAGRARLELARVELSVARAQRLAGQPAPRWQERFERAREIVASVAGADAQELRRQLDELAPFVYGRPIPEAPPPAVAKPPAPNAGDLLRGVNAHWTQGDYATALRMVNRVLAANPRHAEARRWRSRIQSAQEAEAKLSR